MSDSEDDFFALLGKSISNPVGKKENICLISLEQLDTDCIKLECGHCFNYMSIFEEYKKQSIDVWGEKKKKFCCPYCRTQQKDVLPLRACVKYCKFVHQPIENIKCSWEFKYGKRKGEICGSPTKMLYDGKYYCNKHSTLMINKTNKKKTINVVVDVENEVVDVENDVVDVENEVVDVENGNNTSSSISETQKIEKIEKMISELSGIFAEEKLYYLEQTCKMMLITYKNKNKQYVKPAIHGMMATMDLIFGKSVKFENPKIGNLEIEDVGKLDHLNVTMNVIEKEGVKIIPAGTTLILRPVNDSVMFPLKNLNKLMDVDIMSKIGVSHGTTFSGYSLKLKIMMINYIKMMNPS